MEPSSIIIIIIVGVVLLLVFYVIGVYNKLINARNKVKDQFAQIDVQLKRRSDMIPNLVETVKGYSKHENDTLEKITALRSEYNNKNHMDIKSANKMNNELTKYLAVVEAYPELKADTEYLNLQSELSIVEDQLKDAREIYNHVANNYNTAIEVVPSNIVAAIFGFKKAELFKLEDAKKENVEIKL